MGDGNMSGRSQNNQPAKSTNGVGVGDVGSVISANVYNSNSNEGSDVNHNSVITDDGLDDIQPLKTINRYEVRDSNVLRKCATEENSLVVLSNVNLDRSKLSIVLISLIDQLASAYEKDDLRRRILSKEICQSLVAMDLIQPTFLRQEMEGLKAQYSRAFYRLVRMARAGLPAGRSSLPALTGPDHDLVSRSLSSDNLYQNSRYQQEFIEEEYIGGGGFGVVYRAKNKLDSAVYAVKKVFIKINKEDVVLKILREVTVLAKLNHPNIVGYKNAWLEPYLGEHYSSSDGTRSASSNHPSLPSDSLSNLQIHNPTTDNSLSIHFSSLNSSQSLSTDYRISYPPSSGETQEEDLSRSFSHKNTIHGPNPVFHELDDTDVGGIVNGDNGGEKGLPFKTASVQRIQELAGTPPGWKGDVERIIGKPVTPLLSSKESSLRSRRNKSRRRGSKFWLGGEDSESVDSSSIVFLSNSPEEKEDGGNARLTEIQDHPVVQYSPVNHTKLQLERAVLFIQMELCGLTLRSWIDRRNIELFHNASADELPATSGGGQPSSGGGGGQPTALRDPPSSGTGQRSSRGGQSTSRGGQPNSRGVQPSSEEGQPSSVGGLRERDCFLIFQQILRATEYLHSQGILHRDIKPRNIFLNENLQVKLGDFGLAKDIVLMSSSTEDPSPVTPLELREAKFLPKNVRPAKNTSGVGTTAYASPEQLTSSNISSSSDMYSLGVVLFELLTPFNTDMERVKALADLREGTFRNFAETLSDDIKEAILQLTNSSPEKRPDAKSLLLDKFSDSDLAKLGQSVLERENVNLKAKIEELGIQLSAKDGMLKSADAKLNCKDEEIRRLKLLLEKLS